MVSSLFFLDAKRMHLRVMASHELSEDSTFVDGDVCVGPVTISVWLGMVFAEATAVAAGEGTGSLLSAKALATNLYSSVSWFDSTMLKILVFLASRLVIPVVRRKKSFPKVENALEWITRHVTNVFPITYRPQLVPKESQLAGVRCSSRKPP